MRFNILSAPSVFPRAGILETAHGSILTPTYMPVGTYGPVKLLDVEELRSAGAQIVLGNSHHLHSTAGSELIGKLGGLAKFTGWNGPTLTDSGGYQVSYMWRSGTHSMEEGGERKHSATSPVEGINEEGAKIRSLVSGARYLLTPEYAMEIQALIGADIVMAFDQPTFDTDSLEAATDTLGRTHRWTQRSLLKWKQLQVEGTAPSWQNFFPIVQGGSHRELRRESAKFMVELDTDGIAIAGESIGIVPAVSALTLEMVRDIIPGAKPLYAMGLGGGPEGFFEGVIRGVDMFDNTSPTRLGRCGYAFISPEAGGSPENKFRLAVKKGRFREDTLPLDPTCDCKVCCGYSRAFVRHLFQIEDPLGMRLVSYHNVRFMCQLSRAIHEAIISGTFDSLYKKWIGNNTPRK